MNKNAFWPFTKSPAQRAVDESNRQADIMNKPENLAVLNKILKQMSQKHFKRPLSELNKDEWQAAYAHTRAHKTIQQMLELNKTAMEESLKKFLKKNPAPSDEKFHAWAERKGHDTDKAEAGAYRLAGKYVNLLTEGKSKGKMPSGVDPKDLRTGMKIEGEHTDDPALKKKISADHLEEFRKYYKHLPAFEKMLEAEKKGEAMNPLMTGFVDELGKEAGRKASTVVGALGGPLAGLAAEKGKGWRTAGGALLGNIGGQLAGLGTLALPGSSLKAMMAKSLLGGALTLGGGGLGAYLAHGPNKPGAKVHKKD